MTAPQDVLADPAVGRFRARLVQPDEDTRQSKVVFNLASVLGMLGRATAEPSGLLGRPAQCQPARLECPAIASRVPGNHVEEWSGHPGMSRSTTGVRTSWVCDGGVGRVDELGGNKPRKQTGSRLVPKRALKIRLK